MYRADIVNGKFAAAWDNYFDQVRGNEITFKEKLLRVNAIDIFAAPYEIMFFSEEDAMLFLLKYS